MKEIYLAGGCFWGMEHYLKLIRGVEHTEVGYANGHIDCPTYQQVCSDQTGFAETVHLSYQPEILSLQFLLQLYFKAIDPTSLNRQGADHGSQYRTGIFFTDVADRPTILEVCAAEQQHYDQPIAVEVLPLSNFYRAEDYHQDYLTKNPAGYCHLSAAMFALAKRANMVKEP